jgi:hypothetical protein
MINAVITVVVVVIFTYGIFSQDIEYIDDSKPKKNNKKKNNKKNNDITEVRIKKNGKWM